MNKTFGVIALGIGLVFLYQEYNSESGFTGLTSNLLIGAGLGITGLVILWR